LPGCEEVYLAFQQFIGDLGRDPESCRGVLDICYAKIDSVFLDDRMEISCSNLRPGFPKTSPMNNVRIRIRSSGFVAQKKHPRAAVWQIYLNLVTKGCSTAASGKQVPAEKLATPQTDTGSIK